MAAASHEAPALATIHRVLDLLVEHGLSDRLGVQVESHEVTLRGSCGRCN